MTANRAQLGNPMPRRLPILPTPSFSAPVAERPKISVSMYGLSVRDVLLRMEQYISRPAFEVFVESRRNDPERYNMFVKYAEEKRYA